MLESSERRVIRAAVQEKIVELKQNCEKKQENKSQQLQNVKQQLLAILTNENEDADTQVDTQEPQDNSQDFNASQFSNDQQKQQHSPSGQVEEEKNEIIYEQENNCQQDLKEEKNQENIQQDENELLNYQEYQNQQIEQQQEQDQQNQLKQSYGKIEGSIDQQNKLKQPSPFANDIPKYEESPVIKQRNKLNEEDEEVRSSVIVHNSKEDMQNILNDEISQQVHGLLVDQENSGFLNINLEKAVQQPRNLQIESENEEQEDQLPEVEEIQEVSEEDIISEDGQQEQPLVMYTICQDNDQLLMQSSKNLQNELEQSQQLSQKNESAKYNLFDTKTIQKLEESRKYFEEFNDTREESYSEQMNNQLQTELELEIQQQIKEQLDKQNEFDEVENQANQLEQNFRNTAVGFNKVREDIEEVDSSDETDLHISQEQKQSQEYQNFETFGKGNQISEKQNIRPQQQQQQKQQQQQQQEIDILEKFDTFGKIIKQELGVPIQEEEKTKQLSKKTSSQQNSRIQQSENSTIKVTKKPQTAGFKKPSNRKLIKNALAQVCLAGEPNKKRRLETLL